MGQGRGKVLRLRGSIGIDETDTNDKLFFSNDYVFHPPNGESLSVADIPEQLRQNLISMAELTKKKKREVMGLFDQEGNLLLSDFVVGNKYYVDATPEAINLLRNSPPRSLIWVHTHPHSASFSEDDLRVTRNFPSVGTDIVVGMGNVMYTYNTQRQREREPLRLRHARGEWELPETRTYNELRNRLDIVLANGREAVYASANRDEYRHLRNQGIVDHGIYVRIGRSGNVTGTGHTSRNFTELENARNLSILAQKGTPMRMERLTELR